MRSGKGRDQPVTINILNFHNSENSRGYTARVAACKHGACAESQVLSASEQLPSPRDIEDASPASAKSEQQEKAADIQDDGKNKADANHRVTLQFFMADRLATN